jgi:uncharacterized protein (UPF0332 family)
MNEEIQECLNFAKESLDEAHSAQRDGHYRGAVRMSYYTMLHATEGLLLQQGLEFSSHQAVQAALGRNLAATGEFPKHLHSYFVRGFRARQDADYSKRANITKEDGKLWIERAEEFLAAVEGYLEAHPEGA